MARTALKRSAAQLAVALRTRASLLTGQQWEQPATVAMMHEAANLLDAVAQTPSLVDTHLVTVEDKRL